MKRISYIGLAIGLALIVLLSMGGVALANSSALVQVGSEWRLYCNDSLQNVQADHDDIISWHFVLNQWDEKVLGDKPNEVHIVWDDNTSATFGISKENKYVAHYIGNDPDGRHIDEAWVVVPDGSHEYGNLVLSNIDYPCPPVPELPPIALLGIGLLGLGAYAGWRKRKAVFGTAPNS